MGAYRPHNSQTFGAPAGKTRTFCYLICDSCMADETNAEKIEAIAEVHFAKAKVH